MYLGFYEENDSCPKCFKGKLYFPKTDNCSCHLNAPCSACVDKLLVCDTCHEEIEQPEYKDIPIILGEPILLMREYRPRPLDNTKIDYRTKMHTHFSMILEGVYPEGTTKDEVLKKVRGTFGGRFEYFKNGKFKYIAYTD